MKLPSLARLRRGIDTSFVLTGPWQGELPVLLVEVVEGIAVDCHHQCYRAEFTLPAGLQLRQTTASMAQGDEVWPMILFTPVGVDQHGRHRIEAVFHTPRVSEVPAEGPVT